MGALADPAQGTFGFDDVTLEPRPAIGVLVATQIANLALVPWLAHAGLALSVSLGACANALALYAGLVRRGVYRRQPGWRSFVLRLAVALCVLAALLAWAQQFIDWTALERTPWLRAALLAALIAGAAAAYFASLRILGFSLRDFRHDRPAAQ